MKRKLFFLMMILVMAASANAQWSIKPETGIMLIKSSRNYNWNNRFTIGVGAEYEWEKDGIGLGLQSGLYYTQRGYNWHYPSKENSYASMNRGFVQLPVKLNIYIPLGNEFRLTVGAGPYVAYDVNTSWTYGSSNYQQYNGNNGHYGYGNYNTTDMPPIRKWDYGVGVNTGLEFRNIFVNIAYDMSFGKELEKYKAGIQYHNLTFTAGYRFRLGK